MSTMALSTTIRGLLLALVIAASGAAVAIEDAGEGGGALAEEARDGLSAAVGEARAARSLERELAQLHRAVAAFADVERATGSGYAVAGDCMAGEHGAQGIHFANESLFEPLVSVETPQLLMYEPAADGTLRFVGVEYLVFREAWHDAGHVERPSLFGQVFGLNETLLDEPFYLLHVWIGQFNPSGVFADWNPLVSCEHTAAGAQPGR